MLSATTALMGLAAAWEITLGVGPTAITMLPQNKTPMNTRKPIRHIA
jgi:hypothetical protein